MRKKKTHIYLLSPFWTYYILFFFIPLAVLFVYSFWLSTVTGLKPTFTLHNYVAIFSKELYLIVLLRTIRIAFIATLLCVGISYPVAYLLTFKYKKMQDLVLYLILISLFSNYLVRIYAWKIILGRQGLINQTLLYLGLIKEPLSFLLYSPAAVIITLVFIFTPYTILPIYSALQNVGIELIEAAKDLGANNFRTFLKVTLPLSMPGVIVGFIFSFVLSGGDYVTPQLVGGTRGLMIGKIVADQFGLIYNWPFGSALSYTTIFLFFALVYCMIWVLKILKLRR